MRLYDFFNSLAVAVVTLYNLFHYRKKKLLLGGVARSVIARYQENPKPGFKKLLCSIPFWVILETLLVTAAQYQSSAFLNTSFGDLMETGANYFGLVFFAPLLVLLVCVLLKIDPLSQLDLITPAYPLGLIFVKIACHFGGCCRGAVWEYGLYNPTSKLVEFPTPFLEAAAALFLFVFLLLCRKKFKKGTVFPIYLMSYSAIRFFTEFTRCEPSVALGLKTYQFLCIAGVIIGAIEFFAVHLYTSRQGKKLRSKESDIRC